MTQMEMLEHRLFIRLVLFAAAFVFFMTVSAGISQAFGQGTGSSAVSMESNAERMEVSLKKSSEAGNTPILFRDAQRIKRKFRFGKVTFFSEEQAYAKSGSRGEWVELVYTDWDYPSFYELRLRDGVFFNEEVFSRGLNTAVISDELAGRLFGTYGTVGNRIAINNVNYTIIGIFKSENSFISFPGSKKAERIIVPFTSNDSYAKRPVKTVAIRDERFENSSFRKYDLQSILAEDLAINLNSYMINDFYNSAQSVSLLRQLLVFFVGIWCIALVVRLLGRFMARKYGFFKKELKDM